MRSLTVRVIISVCLLPLCCVQGYGEANILTTSTQFSHMLSAILHYHSNFFSKRTKSFSLAMRAKNVGAVEYFIDLLTSVLTTAHEVKVEVNVYDGMAKPKNFDLYNILLIDSYGALV